MGLVTSERARWEVLWVKDRRVVRIPFEHDLSEALRIYTKAKDAGKPGATLRCCNVGFAPPDKYADHEIAVEVKEVRGRMRRVKVKRPIEPRQYMQRMGRMNRKGIWWCPYCMQLRKFVKRKGYRYSGVWVPQPGMHCPICETSHRDGHVAKYNPIARRISGRVKNPNRAAERRRRRQRQAQED